jgi:hypothetical protein
MRRVRVSVLVKHDTQATLRAPIQRDLRVVPCESGFVRDSYPRTTQFNAPGVAGVNQWHT